MEKRYAVIYEENGDWTATMKVLEFSDLEQASQTFEKAVSNDRAKDVMLVEILKD